MGKRNTQWFGGGQIITPAPDGTTTPGEIIQLVPSVQVADTTAAMSEYLIQAIYLHFSIRRTGSADTDPVFAGFMVYQGETVEAGNNPAQALDALALSPAAYSNKRIMMMAPLPVPPVLGTSDLLAASPNDQVMVVHHEFQGTRKHNRSNTILCLAVNADADNVLSIFCQWRALLTY